MKGAWVYLLGLDVLDRVGSLLRKIAINLVRRHQASKVSLKGHRLMADWEPIHRASPHRHLSCVTPPVDIQSLLVACAVKRGLSVR
jgi:hypothetical protein